MKAWVFKTSGRPRQVLKLETDWPAPVPKGRELLVKVIACSLNPVGWKLMGVAPFSYLQRKPAFPELDFSGVVAGGHLEGSGYALGDEVFGVADGRKTGYGALAEHTIVNLENVARKPSTVTHAQAAAFPIGAFTSYIGLVRDGKLKKDAGQRVFINGGSSGTGTWAIQIAKAYGAYVVATCSPESETLVKSLGADETVDYRSVTLASYLTSTFTDKPFDIIYDTVGLAGDLFRASPAYLKTEGVYVDIAVSPNVKDLSSTLWAIAGAVGRLLLPRILGGTPRQYVLFSMPANSIIGAPAIDLLSAGTIHAVIDEQFSFENALTAYDRLLSGRAKGKVIILNE